MHAVMLSVGILEMTLKNEKACTMCEEYDTVGFLLILIVLFFTIHNYLR